MNEHIFSSGRKTSLNLRWWLLQQLHGGFILLCVHVFLIFKWKHGNIQYIQSNLSMLNVVHLSTTCQNLTNVGLMLCASCVCAARWILMFVFFFFWQDVENINSPADEMELYANVSRKFRQIFARQEQLRTFKTYGKSEVSVCFLWRGSFK